MSRLHRTLNTEWNGHDDRACASVMILNILSLTAPKAYIGKNSTCCLASLIRESVCPLKMLPSKGKVEFLEVLEEFLVCMGIPLTFKNVAECQDRGTHALESPTWAYELPFVKPARRVDKLAEGDRHLNEVVENAGNLGSDSMRMSGDGRLRVDYPIIDFLKAVSFDIESLQLGDLRFVVMEDFHYFFRQVFCLVQRVV